MIPGVRVVPMEPWHLDAVSALADALNQEDGEAGNGVTAAVLASDFLGPDRAGDVLVVERDRVVIGYATLHPTYEPTNAARCLYLGDLYVVPDWRRQGIGRALLREAARAAASFPGQILLWHAKADNDAGNAFYRRLGAQPLAVVEWELSGEALSRIADAP